MNIFQIIDDTGVIHSGEYQTMIIAFWSMTRDSNFLIFNGYAATPSDADTLKCDWYIKWTGDLKLVQVLEIYK